MTAPTTPAANPINTTYDAAGNLTSLTDPDGNTTAWTYNSQGQVTQQTDALGNSSSFVYDASGNLARSTDPDGQVTLYRYNSSNQVVAETWYADAADANAGKHAQDLIQFAYNSSGQVVVEWDNNSSDLYSYDAQGRLTSTTESGPGDPTVVLRYQYVGTSDERTSVAASINGVPDYLTSYQYDATGNVTEIDQSGQSGGDAVTSVEVRLTQRRALCRRGGPAVQARRAPV
jgi:YD repeat-containing protein